jgi:pyroglutamyl-peptidase
MILITGFAPFGGDTENPARLSARLAVDTLVSSNISASFLEVPVVFSRTGPTVVDEVARLEAANPSDPVTAVICVGVAGNRKCLSLERTAVNLQDAGIPDNDGDQPRGTPVVPGVPGPEPGAVPVLPGAYPDGEATATPTSTPAPAATATATAAPLQEPNSNKNPNRHKAATLTSRLPLAATFAAVEAAGIPVEISDDAGLYVCNALFFYTLHFLPNRTVGFIHVPKETSVSIERQARALVLASKAALGVN